MYKIYLKQAWQMLKEDKVISIITILGTALAITMIMVIILTQRIKTTNIGPETNREQTMYIEYREISGNNGGWININPVSINEYKQYLNQLQTPEHISMISRESDDICTVGSDIYIRTDIKYTDATFWNIYHLSFQDGRPFSKEEFQSGIPVAVICKSIARKLFEQEDAVGKEFVLNKRTYKVAGIVEDVPTLCYYAYSQIWVPYTSDNSKTDNYKAILLAKDKSDFAKIKEEVRRSEIANNIEKDKEKFHFWGPFSNEELSLKEGNNSNTDDPDLTAGRLKFYLSIGILLLIPAINLSGFSLFKIIRRTPEIGIRKAFGANKKTILIQVLYENLLTSLMGGIIGLILSFIVVTTIKDRLFGNNRWDQVLGENTIPVSAFLSVNVFIYVFFACVLLNLLSSGIPAWKASRMNIVDAIRS